MLRAAFMAAECTAGAADAGQETTTGLSSQVRPSSTRPFQQVQKTARPQGMSAPASPSIKVTSRHDGRGVPDSLRALRRQPGDPGPKEALALDATVAGGVRQRPAR